MSAQHTPGPWHARMWQCHAATSVGREVDGRFEQIAECSALGRQVSAEQEVADARLIAAAPLLFDRLETLVDALTSGAGRDFIEAFVRDASAALEEAQPGWNKVDEPTSYEMRAKGRVRDAAPELLEALKAALPRVAHTAACHSARPTEEWAAHGSVSYENCCCERKLILAAIATAEGRAA